jgi:hypothetical protein
MRQELIENYRLKLKELWFVAHLASGKREHGLLLTSLSRTALYLH